MKFWRIILKRQLWERGVVFLPISWGEQVFAKLVSVIEDPHLEYSVGQNFWDQEGVATHPRMYINQGVLCNIASDITTAMSLDLLPTGNGIRKHYQDSPSVGFHMLFLEPGSKDFVDLVRDVGKGFVVRKLLAVKVVNSLKGDLRLKVIGDASAARPGASSCYRANGL